MIVVTRFFGGIKLGTGGLVRAYTDVAKAAISASGVSIVRNMVCTRITTEYKVYNKIKSEMADKDAIIDNEEFTEKVSFDLTCSAGDNAGMLAFARELANGDITEEPAGERRVTIPK